MHSDACYLSAFFRLGVGEDAVLIQRVNECQCVNTGSVFLLRQWMFIDVNFSAAINGKSICFV